ENTLQDKAALKNPITENTSAIDQIKKGEKQFWQEGLNQNLNHKNKNKNKNEKGDFMSFIKETLLILATALIISFVLKAFIIDTRVIPTLSMYPTVDAGDRVIVNKLSYIGDRKPQRGDIIVFKAPPELNSKDDLLKRVIGLPGDQIEIHDKLVFVNGVPLEEDYIEDSPVYYYGSVQVPEGKYFMMGDNRNHSVDSHMWQDPFVPEKDIKGRAFCRYWPLDRMASLYADKQDDINQAE
ncbi:MAG: signal peptidase I, partial [Clostridiales bacterium]